MTARIPTFAVVAVALSAAWANAEEARLRSPDPAVRAAAAAEQVSAALAVEGEAATEAEFALVALGKASPEVVSNLIRRVKARETHYRQRAAAGRVLTQIGAPAATSELLEAMTETYCPVPGVIIRVLRDMGPPSYSLVVQGMRHENTRIRARCEFVLKFRARSDPAAAALLSAFKLQAASMPMLDDADAQARLAAVTDLTQTALAEPMLAGASFDALLASAAKSSAAAEYDAGILEIARKSPAAAGKLILALRGTDRFRRNTALRLLPKLGAALSNPEMTAAFGDHYCPVPYMLRRVLIVAGPDAAEVVHVGLNHTDSGARRIAVAAIAAWARSSDVKVSGDPRVATAMVSALKHSDPYVRSSAARAAERLGKSQIVLAALLKALDDPDTQVQTAAVDSLRAIGRSAAN